MIADRDSVAIINGERFLWRTRDEQYVWRYRFYLESAGASIQAMIALRDEIEAWCTEQFGPESPNDNIGFWYNGGGAYRLREADHAFAFKMRWL